MDPTNIRAKDDRPVAATGVVLRGLSGIWALFLSDVSKLRRDWIELASRAVQPVLWLVIFGKVLTRAGLVEVGSMPYLSFITPGVIAQSAMFVAIFYGVALIWERDVGFTNQLLVTPTPRWALALGKGTSAALRGVLQMVFTAAIAAALGVSIKLGPDRLAEALVLVLLGSITFANVSLVIAGMMKGRDRFLGMGQLMTMPIFFASNAIYPLSAMPAWLHVVALFNPMSYEVDGLRQTLVSGSTALLGVGGDIGLLAAFTLVTTTAATIIYGRVAT